MMDATVETIATASNLTELANTKMSTAMAAYYIDGVRVQPGAERGLVPTFSYGLQLTRQADAPPSTLVDVESQLSRRYDIIGKTGLVYERGDRVPSQPPPTPTPPALATASDADTFFTPSSDRDFHRLSSKACERKLTQFWRDEVIVAAPQPYNERAIGTLTRQATKDRRDGACA